MVKLASSQVPGALFEKRDMLTFQPPPGTRYDAVFAIFSMLQLTRDQVYGMMVRYAEWLKPGGVLVIGTIPAGSLVGDSTLYDPEGKLVRHAELVFMGRGFEGTVYTEEGWRGLCTAAGFEIECEKRYNFKSKPPYEDEIQDHYFIQAKKVVEHPLMGPFPLPAGYRGPHPLSEGAWAPFAERLVREEFDAVLNLLRRNKKVLDVGSGYGELPIRMAQSGIQAYSIEPNADRRRIQEKKPSREQGVSIATGSIDKIPFENGMFDAVVAMWVLHYIDDLDAALRELARVANPTAPNARIIIVQGAPDNELVNMLNTVCAPLSAHNTIPDHQGYLLHRAAAVFAQCGFGDVEVHRVDAYCAFPETDLEERCAVAAEVLAGFWFKEDANFNEMKSALIPHLKLHFKDRAHAIGDQVAILVARPQKCVDC